MGNQETRVLVQVHDHICHINENALYLLKSFPFTPRHRADKLGVT